MRKIFRNIALLIFVGGLFQGCFKDVVTYTNFNIAVQNQTTSNGALTPATELSSYAFYVDTTEWTILSYEDALAARITNKTTGQSLTEPDVRGSFDSAAPYQVSMRLEAPLSMLVVVNPELRLYAYRNYQLPVNLEQVDTKLIFSSWRASHSSSGWQIENDFYTEEETPANE